MAGILRRSHHHKSSVSIGGPWLRTRTQVETPHCSMRDQSGACEHNHDIPTAFITKYIRPALTRSKPSTYAADTPGCVANVLLRDLTNQWSSVSSHLEGDTPQHLATHVEISLPVPRLGKAGSTVHLRTGCATKRLPGFLAHLYG